MVALPPPQEAIRHFADGVIGPLARRCARSVVPIYEGVTDGYPVLVGTGTLFAVDDQRFLVTAAHVAEDFIERRAALLTSDATTGKNLAYIDYDWARAAGEFDVAVFRLGPQAIEVLKDLDFLRLDQVELAPVTTQGLYYVHGFPRAFWRPDPKNLVVGVAPISLLGTNYTGSTSGWRFDKQIHVAVELMDDGELPPSERQNVPDSLKGISGCSIWWLRGAFEGPGGFRGEDAKIVAVQTGTHERDSVVVGTHWAAAVVLIRRYCPELAPALRLHTSDEPNLVVPARIVLAPGQRQVPVSRTRRRHPPSPRRR